MYHITFMEDFILKKVYIHIEAPEDVEVTVTKSIVTELPTVEEVLAEQPVDNDIVENNIAEDVVENNIAEDVTIDLSDVVLNELPAVQEETVVHEVSTSVPEEPIAEVCEIKSPHVTRPKVRTSMDIEGMHTFDYK